MKALVHWASKADYTIIDYRGIVPRKTVLTAEGIAIPLRDRTEPEFVPLKRAGGLVPLSKLVEELQKTGQRSGRDYLAETAILGIVNRTVQYSLESLVDSRPAKLKDWPDPPHVEFANCTFNGPEDVKRFVEDYGFSPDMIHDPVLHSPEATTVSVDRLKQNQEFLRRSWGKAEHVEPLKDAFIWSPDEINVVNGKPRIVLRDIWSYIFVLFLIDLTAERLKVCEYPNCQRLKYFVKGRSDQKCCSTACKNAVISARFYEKNSEDWNARRREAYRDKSKSKTKAARGGR